jgi:hypothetical protein
MSDHLPKISVIEATRGVNIRRRKIMTNKSIPKTKDTAKDAWIREHCDDWSLQLIEEQKKEFQIYQLVVALIDNCRELGKQVVELRQQVNRLTPSGQPEPYVDLYSDLYESFYDYATYPKFKRILKRLE